MKYWYIIKMNIQFLYLLRWYATFYCMLHGAKKPGLALCASLVIEHRTTLLFYREPHEQFDIQFLAAASMLCCFVYLINVHVVLDDNTALRPVTPPDEHDDCRDKTTAKTTSVGALPGYCTDSRRLYRPVPERTITVANPDLLMKLFDVVDTGRKMNHSLTGQLRRGRSVIRLLCC